MSIAPRIAGATIVGIPASRDPRFKSAINPRFNASINPKFNADINPKYNAVLNPKLYMVRLIGSLLVFALLGLSPLAATACGTHNDRDMSYITDKTLQAQRQANAGNWRAATQTYAPLVQRLLQWRSEPACTFFATEELSHDYDDLGDAAAKAGMRALAISSYPHAIEMLRWQLDFYDEHHPAVKDPDYAKRMQDGITQDEALIKKLEAH